MSIPYNDNLRLSNYWSNPGWYQSLQEPTPDVSSGKSENQGSRAATELSDLCFKRPLRSVQFIRDAARLVLKVPIRAIATPICLEKNWKERERAKVNAKLTGYSFVQLISVPVKFTVALIAIATSPFSQGKAKWLLDKSEGWTARNDGRASQLEALKEEGIKQAKNRMDVEAYRSWLYEIDPKLCRKPKAV